MQENWTFWNDMRELNVSETNTSDDSDRNVYNTSVPYDVMKNTSVLAVFFLVYLIIFTLGIFGNCLVCYVVFKNKHMQTVTNFFIANLALADILLCVLAVPFTPLYFAMGRWAFGRVLCKLVPVTQGTSVYVSTLTLMSIAVDRYFVIIHPFRPKLQLIVCYSIIISIWLFSMSSTMPYAYYVNQELYEDVLFCEEFWPSEFMRRIFSSFTTIMQFGVPFIIILYCYVMISVRMNERIRIKSGSRGSQKEESDREKKRRTNRMLIAMVTIFGGCWLPFNTIHLVGDYNASASKSAYYNLCFFITHTLAMSSTCYNPLLYAWLNENFRKEFMLVLPCFKSLDGPAGRKSVYRSERTDNNITVGETLPHHGNTESSFVVSVTCRDNHKVQEEMVQLTTIAEELATNGEIREKNGEAQTSDTNLTTNSTENK
ncbi:prolactin-releasing peptide receptor-like [Hyalella azteca]|uniref:Prolactin-releasing peptide receptor-like n=1 Tax=Hyalella azteca TaxID=294128 RepID=A0A8B7P8Z0_HYAAZ|nr:prolactin-releasing peptide receptor-like [Hyalella azteca]